MTRIITLAALSTVIFVPACASTGEPEIGPVRYVVIESNAVRMVRGPRYLAVSFRDSSGEPIAVEPEISTSGPISAGWNGGLRLVATDTGKATVKISAGHVSANIDVEVVALTAKGVHMSIGNGCMLDTTARAWCWGGNYSHQLGALTPPQCNGGSCQYGGVEGSLVPLQVGVTAAFVDVAVQSYPCSLPYGGSSQVCGTACGLTANGNVQCWGSSGALQGPAIRQLVMGGGRHTSTYDAAPPVCGLGVDGKAYCVTGTTFVEVGSGKVFTSFSRASTHSCGVDPNGDAYCWGSNDHGALGTGGIDAAAHPTPERVLSSTKFLSVAVGDHSSCALDVGGVIHCWGTERPGQFYQVPDCSEANPCRGTPAPLPGGSTYTALAHNYRLRVCGLTAGGEVDCWNGHDVQPMRDPVVEKLTAITVGAPSPEPSVGANWSYHACGVGVSGAVHCWSEGSTRIGG